MIGLGWVLHALTVTTLLALGAWSVERSLERTRVPQRWTWAAALGLALVIPGAALLSGPDTGESAAVSLSTVASGPGAPAAEVGELVGTSPGSVVAWLGGPVTTALRGVAARVPEVPWFAPLFLLAWIASTTAVGVLMIASHLHLRRQAADWARTEATGVPVRLSKDFGPATVGIRTPEIVLPAWTQSLPESRIGLIVRHEASHVAAGDTRLLAAALVPAILLPWNPGVWWMLRRLRDAVELDCDRRTLPAARSAGEYGRLLLESSKTHAGSSSLLAPALGGRPSLLERRLLALRAPPSRRERLGVGAAAVTAILAITVSCGADVPVVGELDEVASVPSTSAPGDASPPTAPDARPGVPESDRAGEENGSAASRSVSDAGGAPAPTFTPFTVAPEITNRNAIVRELAAEYPSTLRDAGVGGRVLLHFFIGEDGSVDDVQVAESSGFPELDAAALRVGRLFEFTPARNGDDPTAVWIQAPVTFQPR